MASGRAFSGTLSGGSEFVYEFCCAPCSKDGAIVEAINQCCNEYYCGKCIDFHKKFSPSPDHKVLGIEEMRKAAKSSKPKKPLPPSQLCQEHGGDRFAIYCSDHDVVCCNTGVSVSHKACDGTEYIVTASAGIKSSEQLQTTKTSISSTLKEAKRGKSSRQSYLTDIDTAKAANIQQVEDFTERFINRILELKRATIEEITSKHQELSADVGREIASLDDVISTMEGYLKKIDSSHGNHEAQVFVDVKLGQSHEAECRKLLQQQSKSRKPSLKFLLKRNIEDLLKGLSSLVVFADESHMYQAKLKGDYNIKVQQDTKTCDILGSCQLPGGTVMIVDRDNIRLKRLDATYSVTDHCNLPSFPWAVTCTAPDEVAVTLSDVKKVQFVTVSGSMSLSRSFPTSDDCRGIAYSGGQLYVACGGMTLEDYKEGPGHVAIYTLKGMQLKKIQTDPAGQNIFSQPFHITATCDCDRVYVGQWKEEKNIDASVLILRRDGTLVGSITDPSLITAWGVCTINNGYIIVSGRDSNNVLLFDGDGRKVTELLKDTDGTNKPQSLCYDSRKSRLIVTMENTDNIKVFDLK